MLSALFLFLAVMLAACGVVAHDERQPSARLFQLAFVLFVLGAWGLAS